MVHLMNETTEISSIFTSVLEDRYKGFDIDTFLFRLEEIISSNNSNAIYGHVVIDNALNIANRDFKFYVRIMNWTIENSTICLSYFFMKSALQLIKKEYDGKVGTLLSNHDNNIWVHLFYNCIWVIVHNRLIGEVDISVSSENVFIGKDSKSIVPVTYLEKDKVQILDLLHDKYVQILIHSESEHNDIDFQNSISKLNRVYQYYTDFKIDDITEMVYSQDNVEQYLSENNLKPNCYDELLFEKHGFLFFPLITSIIVKDGKLSISNEGYGSLANCKFCINYNGKSIFSKEIEINNDDTYDICIEDDLKSEIQNIDSNDKIDFCFLFQKFNRNYRFSISEEARSIKEGLSKKENGNMSIIIDKIVDVFTNPLLNSRKAIKTVLEPFNIRGLQDEKNKNLATHKQIRIALKQMIEENDVNLPYLLTKLCWNYQLSDVKIEDFNRAIQKLGLQFDGSKVIPHNNIEPPTNCEEFIDTIEKILNIFIHDVNTMGYKFLYNDEGKPKKEKECQDLLDFRLKYILQSRGIDLTRETDTRRGLVDFRAFSVHCTVHIEIKKSTNPDLFHGLEKQLPTYMDSEKVHHGFFIIFDFGEKNITELKNNLERQRVLIERNKDIRIKIFYVDATKKLSASKV